MSIFRLTKGSVVFAILAFTLFFACLWGQIISSSIVGQVSDATGAAVPDVQITVTNMDTGIAVKTTADSSGAYSVPNLQPGRYQVEATKTGFQTFLTTGNRVLASQAVRIDIRLTVGEVQQSVSVTSEAPLIRTESPTVGATLDRKDLSTLPVAQQSIEYVMNLVPGAQVIGSSPQIGGGTHWGSTNFTINGTQANDFGNGAAAYSYGTGLLSLPALPSMQEFKVEAYNTSAEFRQLGTVTMVTKAGTNQIHGEAYEYNQNRALNANSFTNNARGVKRPAVVKNQFGVNAGGPIIKNKAFAFYNFTGYRYRTYGSPSLTFPSMAMRGGDFSALYQINTQLYDPYSGQPFVNNQIPASRFAPQVKTLLGYLPATTSTINAAGLPNGGINYYSQVAVAQDANESDVRIDWQISDSDQIYGTYVHNIGFPYQNYLGYPSTYGNATNFGYKTFGYTLVETHTFNPRTFNTFRFAWFDHPSIRSGQNLDFDPTTLFPQLTKSPNRGLPTMSIGGYSGMWYDYGKGYYGHGFNFEYSDDVTRVIGRHTLKAGAQLTTYKNYGPNPNAPLGSFSFNGQWTGNKGWPGQAQSQGNAFADFLLGVTNSTSTGLAGVFSGVYWAWDNEFYVQDTWQASPKLTIYYGLRYMYQTPWNWQNGYSTYWDPKVNRLALPQDSDTATLPPIGASPGMFAAYNFTTTKALGLPSRYMLGDKNNWAPRLGIAWRPFNNNRTVFRAGYGVYYNFNPAFVGSRDDILSPPWVGGLGGFSGSNYISAIPGKPSAPFLPDLTFADPFPAKLGAAAGVSAHPTIYSMQRDFRNGAIQQWNATLEHEFANNWAARLTYAGSQSHHLQWFFSDFNVPMKQTPNVPAQDQRPFQPWATIQSTRSGGSQNFEQLQLGLNKRFSQGFRLQAEYQWTRSLDNIESVGGQMNPNFPGWDYGNSSGILRHRLVFYYYWELPIGRGKALGTDMNRVLDAVVGGWQVSGISTIQTGSPFSVTFSAPSGFIGWWTGTGRADRVGGQLYNRGGGHDIISGVPWINLDAFAPPQPWNWGNSSRNLMFGPGSWNFDISLQKGFKIKERARFEVRSDFLNAFNHFNLGNPSATIADIRDGGQPIATSGKIYGGSGSRVVQLVGRFTF
ncbi:MAG: carboxypeptidase regulatory-like domain-containing protein [Bryobacterales bacterium]|nr:carboxypeptidase regulatory-like domain-containing protein [Bryobacterales bacterium]